MDLSYLSHSPAASQWNKIAVKHHHGIAVPLFSLHSAQSTGIGEYPDLMLLIDWCKHVGLDLIQLLPINDTGSGTSPYSALSAFALNPIYLGLNVLPHLYEHANLINELKAIPKFSYSSSVDYSTVNEYKMRFLTRYFEVVGDKIQLDPNYHAFLRETEFWLKGYVAYKILRKRHQDSNWESWPESDREVTVEKIQSLEVSEKEAFNFYCVLQFLCDQQMKEAKMYAEKQHISLLGDIPILIDRSSADVWLYREYFDLNYSAGAPPDMFSRDGQNWGFPIYKWDVLAQHDYEWWKKRLQYASRYYHIYRIDHIVGFFRIWTIPHGLTGKDGYFVPEDSQMWIDLGQRLMLMMLSCNDMLPIGEDLGVVPTEVRRCLSSLGICGTRVMRWERKWHEDMSFIEPENYPMLSMTTVATHDSETIKQWWMLNPNEAKIYAQAKGWSYHPILSRVYHKEILWESHHTSSLFHVNPLQEYLALIPGLTSRQLEEERINVPGIVSYYNWTYRIKPTLEELASSTALKQCIQELIQ